jgi:hypothetical protein
VAEEGAVTKPEGQQVGVRKVLRGEAEGVEVEAVVWTDLALLSVAMGPPGAAVEFYNQIPY